MKPIVSSLLVPTLRLLVVVAAVATLAYGQAGGGTTATQQSTFAHSADRPKYAPGRLLVRFKPQKPRASIESFHALVGAEVLKTYPSLRGLQLVRLPLDLSEPEAMHLYKQNPDVLYAEPDYVVYADVLPNDPFFTMQWGLHNTGQQGGTPGADIHAPDAWNRSTGSDGIVIGVIDSGVDFAHQDLQANIFRNEPECNGLPFNDDDGNGYIDDCHGFNAIPGKGGLRMGDPVVYDEHATHVAGIIGALGNNGTGVTGVNWHVKILNCQFMGGSGTGYISDALICLDYMATMKDRGANIVATNNSWGGGAYSQALADAIDVQRQKGILFVAAAGNDGLDNELTPHFPADYFLPNIISVAATDPWDEKASFSNWGRYSVHLGAPGVSIASTFPKNSYGSLTGTSMATPFVTGTAALLKAEDPTRDWISIKNLLLAGGDSRTSLAKTITQKRLNAYGAMTCSDSEVEAQLQPAGPLVTSTPGTSFQVTELNINCGSPNAGDNISVSINPGGSAATLRDDGVLPDQAAHDGIYTGSVTLPANRVYTLTFPNGNSLTAQVLIPYASPSATAYNYRTISGNYLSLGDDTTAQFKSPFPIPFGGGSFDTVHVSSNGTLSLVTNYDSSLNLPLPYSGTSTIVAPWWDDLMPQRGKVQNVYWDVSGSAPNRELVIEWRDVPHYSDPVDTSSTVTFQVVFFEDKSDILFNYQDTVFGGANASFDNGALATVGVQVASGAATQYSYQNASLTDGLALLWQLSGNPVPRLSSLLPSTALPGGPEFTLTVNGANFLPSSVVRWNGSDRSTTFVSGAQLTALISAADLAAAGSASVTVFNSAPGGGESPPLAFAVTNPIPTLSSTTPTSASAGTVALTMTVTGSDFLASSVVRWNGADRTTTFISSTELTASITAADIATGGAASVTVYTPTPGGGTSTTASFTITDYGVGASPNSNTVTAGQAATYAVTVTPSGGIFDRAVSLSCAGLPSLASCSFSPASVTPNGSPAASTLTISTKAVTVAMLAAPRGQRNLPLLAFLLPFSVTGLVVVGSGTRRKALLPIGLALWAVLLLFSSVGCGSTPKQTTPGTPAGTYTITVSATAGTVVHTGTVTLVVQ